MKMEILLFAGILCLLLASPVCAADMMSIERPIMMPDEGRDTVAVDIEFISEIDENNMEFTNYTITAENKQNYTLKGDLRIYFDFMPEHLSVLVDGEEAEIITESESYQSSRYLVKFTLAPEEAKTMDIDYAMLKVPQRWNIGLWSLKYYYNSPLNFHFETKDDEYFEQGNIRYDGEIFFNYDISDVSCNNCVYADNKVTVEDASYFSMNWEKKRIPIKAGIVYLCMIFAIVIYLAKKRK